MNSFILKKIKKEAKELQHENRFIKYAHVLDFFARRSGFNSYQELKEKLNSNSSDNQNILMKQVLNKRKNILDSIEVPEKKEKENEFIEKLEKHIV